MKMNNAFIIIYSSFVLVLFSCNNSDESHRIIKEYDNKKVVKEYTVNKMNQKDGTYKEYYSNGKRKILLNYSSNTLKGEQKSFYENGSLQSIGYYLNDRLDSIQKSYYPNGMLKSEAFRLEGKLFGVQKEYSFSGKLKDLYFMTNDSDMASSLDFDSGGKIIKKVGNIIYSIYNKNILHTQDTAGAIFYIYFPSSYQCECELIESKRSAYTKREKCKLIEINNNRAILVQRSFKEPGDYEIGVSIKMVNKTLQSIVADSMFLKIKVL